MIPYQLSTVDQVGLWGLIVSIICVGVLYGARRWERYR